MPHCDGYERTRIEAHANVDFTEMIEMIQTVVSPKRYSPNRTMPVGAVPLRGLPKGSTLLVYNTHFLNQSMQTLVELSFGNGAMFQESR